MANTLTDEQYEEARSLLVQMRNAQTKLWNLSLELEEIIGCAVDTTEDFYVVDLQYFIDKNQPI